MSDSKDIFFDSNLIVISSNPEDIAREIII
jgi:hypothetical protein